MKNAKPLTVQINADLLRISILAKLSKVHPFFFAMTILLTNGVFNTFSTNDFTNVLMYKLQLLR